MAKTMETSEHQIKNAIFKWKKPKLNRKEEITINRLRRGHSRLTHEFFLWPKENLLNVNSAEFAARLNTY